MISGDFSHYILSEADTIQVRGKTLYRILYLSSNFTGGYVCENSDISNSYVCGRSIIIDSNVEDSYIGETVVDNSTVVDSTLFDCCISWSKLTECNVNIDISMGDLHSEELIDNGKVKGH